MTGHIVCGLFLLITHGFCQDPCTNPNLPILDEPHRSSAFVPSTADHLICDVGLVAGWYRFGKNENMPTTCVPKYHCGTNAPVWLQGILPTVAEGVAPRKACINYGDPNSQCCDYSLNIKVKNCGNHYVYYLVRAPGCAIAYCAGTKPVCGIGTYNTTSKSCNSLYPKLRQLPELLSPEVINRDVRFPCKVNYPTGEPGVGFNVMWNVNGDVIMDSHTHAPVETKLKEDQRIAYLDTKYLEGHLGKNLHCNVTAFYQKSPTLKGEQLGSNPYWVGIRVSKTSLTATEKQSEQDIILESTIPIPCNSPMPQFCKMEVELKASNNPNDVSTNKCRYELVYDPNTKTYRATVKVKATRDFVDDKNRNHEMVFRPVFGGSHRMWNGYQISPVQIHTVDVKSGWCQGTGDPHWIGLDKRHYNTYEVGDFVLYRSKCRNFEVQVRTWACGSYKPCICGVVAKEGNDIVKFDMCERKKNIVSAPEVISLGTHTLEETTVDMDKSGKHFFLNFASGSRIKIDAGIGSPKSHPNEKNGYMNVFIQAPSDDNQCVEGLCGTWTNKTDDDFEGPNGHLYPNEKSFSHSWRVPIEQSLFSVQPPYTKSIIQHFCKCGGNGNVDCTKGKGANNPSSKAPCPGGTCINLNNNLQHPRRSIDVNAESAIEEDLIATLARRATPTTWPTASGISQASARTMCVHGLQQASLFKHCGSTHANVPFEAFVAGCMEDILYAGGDEFTIAHMNSFDNACLDSLYRNMTNYHTDSNGEMVFSLNADQLTCPNNCDRKGSCVQGRCVCNLGYIGDDCSVQANTAPSVFSIRGEGTCDLRKDSCVKANIIADNLYLSPKLQCRYRKAHMVQGKMVPTSGFIMTDAVFKNFLEVECTLPSTVVSFNKSLDIFELSVSTDGQRWSQETQFVVYDSKCQTCDSQGTCILKNGTCLINGVCFSRGEQNSAQEVCEPSKSTIGWINIPGVKEVDQYTASFTGCRCQNNPSIFTCACCQNDGCQCGAVQPNQCAHCKELVVCGKMPNLFPRS